jgi:hypothetical protein
VECELNEKRRLLALSPVQRERALRERISWLQQQMVYIQTKAMQRFTLMDRRKNTPSRTPAASEAP